MGEHALPAVRSRVLVARPRDHVFEEFVRRTGRWWPLREQAMAPALAADVRIDPWEGGALAEVWDDGTEHPWGTLVRWRPPCELVVDWTAHDDGATTTLTVRFLEASWVTSWVEVRHDGWSALGAEAPAIRESYQVAWPRVLGAFLASV